ncbi:RES domain-containing protein [Bacillus sp. FJAT-29937]|uniref:RES domain-containing protein n=1 Tax=Bacillus sp. FJAT-29937 TaxID=1720553 RepID=UPI0008324D03|nr:RES domain-containing protein [Bacillus sp. FJAT-29937]
MNSCEKCFKDRYMISIIKKQNTIGNCDYCGHQNVYTIDIAELSMHFERFNGYYEKLEHGENFIYGEQDPTEVGESLYELIQSEWGVFSIHIEGNMAKVLLTDIVETFNGGFDEDDLYVRAAEAFTFETSVEIWNDFTNEIKHGNRFFPTKAYINDNLIAIFQENEYVLPNNSIIYRGRLDRQPIIKMGAPPMDKATPGRANPRGISYLYASKDIDTCVAELRPYKSAKITMATMITSKPLKLVRLNVGGTLVSPFQFKGNLIQSMESFLLLEKLIKDLSKPVNPSNSELDYLPTQYLAELIKNQGYDGFLFQSALGPKENYVIFNEKNVTIESIDFLDVKDVRYSTSFTI